MATLHDLLAIKGSEVVSVRSTDMVSSAAKLMNERNIGGLIVYEGTRVAGIFTERDVVRRVIAKGLDPATTPVADVMTSPVVTVTPDLSIEDCAALMTIRRLRHLPVGEGDKLEGMLSIGDLLAQKVREQETVIGHMNKYIHDLR